MADQCPATTHARPGDDPIKLGVCIGHAMEPGDRFGRLVAIRHHAERQIERFIIRCYQPSDGAWPTGEYRSTSIIGIVPHVSGGEH